MKNSCINSIVDLIGETPTLKLLRIAQQLQLEGSLLLKLELYSPGGSKKDRVALAMVRAAIASGALQKSQPVLEVTSGNTGIGLAIVCRALGHPFCAVMSRGNSPERAQMMRAMGAEVILVDQDPTSIPGRVSGPDMKLVRQRAALLVKELGAYFCDQFENPANRQAHIDTTGPELWRQSGGTIDTVIGFVGSGVRSEALPLIFNALTRIFMCMWSNPLEPTHWQPAVVPMPAMGFRAVVTGRNL
jgi:cysteine synthase A